MITNDMESMLSFMRYSIQCVKSSGEPNKQPGILPSHTNVYKCSCRYIHWLVQSPCLFLSVVSFLGDQFLVFLYKSTRLCSFKVKNQCFSALYTMLKLQVSELIHGEGKISGIDVAKQFQSLSAVSSFFSASSSQAASATMTLTRECTWRDSGRVDLSVDCISI